jgi:hypothetical protein
MHFGMISEDFFSPISVAGHDDPEVEFPFVLDLQDRGGYAAFVSGSWQQWYKNRQAVDGDDSLHVVVVLGTNEPASFDLAVAMRDAVVARTAGDARPMNMTVVTDSIDWQKYIQYIALPHYKPVR